MYEYLHTAYAEYTSRNVLRLHLIQEFLVWTYFKNALGNLVILSIKKYWFVH